MGSRSSVRIFLRVTVITVVFAAGVAGQVLLTRGQSDWAQAIVGAALVTLVSMGAVLRYLRRQVDTKASLDEATEALAVAVRQQWEAAALERGLVNPVPVPVRWKWTEMAVTGPVIDAIGHSARAVRFPALPGVPRIGADDLAKGELHDLFFVYAGIDSGRIVVVGSAGAGKTGAAILLVVDAIKHRDALSGPGRRMTPVPILLNCRGWDPYSCSFAEWLAQQLKVSYRLLAAAEYGDEAAERLVAEGRIVLVLDGFDEVPEELRPAILWALNAQASCRLVLLTRGQQFAAAVSQGHLAGAAALELLAVSRSDAADYLERCRVHPASPAWHKLIEHVRSASDATVAEALNSPLTLSLVRDTIHLDQDTTELLDPDRFTDSDDVVAHLLGRVLPAAYSQRPGRTVVRYALPTAQKALCYIAWQMNTQETRDLAWWRIPRWQRPAFRAAINGVLAASVFATLGWFAFGMSFGLLAAMVGLIAGAAVGAFAEWKPDDAPVQMGPIKWRALASSRTNTLNVIGLATGIGYGTLGGATFGLKGGVVFGTMFGIAITLSTLFATSASILIAAPSAESGSPIDPLTVWRRDRAAGILLGSVFAAAFGALGGVAFGLTFSPAAGIRFGIAGGLIAGSVMGLTFIRSWDARLAFFQLWRAGYTPLLLMRFLEDAHGRGILRTVGPVYQFRHARLQDLLAAQHNNKYV